MLCCVSTAKLGINGTQPGWFILKQAIKESFLLGLRHVICTFFIFLYICTFVLFFRGTRGTDSCRHCPTVTLVSLQDISFAFNFDFVYPKNGFQTKVYRQGCG